MYLGEEGKWERRGKGEERERGGEEERGTHYSSITK